MRRLEKRKLARRRLHRKNLKAMNKYCRYKFELWFLDGNRRRLHLAFRAGKYRHQPRRVREIIKGKRYIQTREEQSKTDEFVASIVKATFRLALGVDETDVFDDLHAELRGVEADK